VCFFDALHDFLQSLLSFFPFLGVLCIEYVHVNMDVYVLIWMCVVLELFDSLLLLFRVDSPPTLAKSFPMVG